MAAGTGTEETDVKLATIRTGASTVAVRVEDAAAVELDATDAGQSCSATTGPNGRRPGTGPATTSTASTSPR